MKKFFYLTALFFIVNVYVYAQYNTPPKGVVRCATDAYMEMMFEKDPSYAERLNQINKESDAWIAANKEMLEKNKNIITIPVVFHILYFQDHPAFNIPEYRIHEQLEVLNEDFRRLNADASLTPAVFQSVAADAQIEFCLAQRTPSGNLTDGIVRVKTNVVEFNVGNSMKYASQGGSNAWDRSKYLNVWVCNLEGGVLGFAQMPGGPAATDGIVVHYRNFGVTGTSSPYNKGRTATHEVGHWLNLHHIWGDDAPGACTGTDYCNDTPNQADPYYGCPSFPQYSCGSSDMFMNYMDYTNDVCMNIFTNNQRMRMWAALFGPRNSIRTSNGCQPGHGTYIEEPSDDIISFNIYPNPSQGIINIQLETNQEQKNTLFVYNTYGHLVHQETFKNHYIFNKEIMLDHLSKGVYFVQLTSSYYTITRKITLL